MDVPNIYVGKAGEDEVYLLPRMSNRHGLITGATGTGKTVTLQTLAEQFSSIGVPVFMADVKGDLSGIAQAGGGNPKVEQRAKDIGMDLTYFACPTAFWDVFGEKGHPLRATVSEMGPLLLSRILGLNDVQEGVLNVTFRVADEMGALLLDLKDLRTMLSFVDENSDKVRAEYGLATSNTVGAILRSLLVLEQQGAEGFFGEPAVEVSDLLRCDADGMGIVNVLAADRLMQTPRLYAAFLLWLLSELYEQLPEVGDLDKPRLVFFFDEAHLLFDELPSSVQEKVEQVVRLIRSKGVGVFFVTQNPLDVPDKILGQLGNRVQHALRAFTPRDQKAVRTAAETFRPNPAFSTEEVITQLGVGEALVSTLQSDGTPSIVQRTLICPPSSRVGPCEPAERQASMVSDGVGDKYNQTIDRDSAYEMVRGRVTSSRPVGPGKAMPAQPRVVPPPAAPRPTVTPPLSEPGAQQAPQPRQAPSAVQPSAWLETLMGGGLSRNKDSFVEALGKSVLRSAGSQIGRQVTRGILGSIFRS